MTEKTEESKPLVILPRTEWKAFTDDVRQLIRSDEELLNAYNRLLNAYEQLSEAYSQLSQKWAPGKRTSGVRGLFGRRQASDSTRSCTSSGASLEPKDKTCPACGKSVESAPEQKEQEQPKRD